MVVAARDGITSPEAAAAVDIVAVKEVMLMVIQLAAAVDQRTLALTKPIPQTLVAVTVRLSFRISPVHP